MNFRIKGLCVGMLRVLFSVRVWLFSMLWVCWFGVMCLVKWFSDSLVVLVFLFSIIMIVCVVL